MRDAVINTLAGAFCGVTVDSIIYPLDTIKTRHQAKMGMVTVKSYTHLFKGLGTILMGSVPASAIYWAIYERTKKALKSSTNDRPELYTVCEMGAAMVAESFASTSSKCGDTRIRSKPSSKSPKSADCEHCTLGGVP